MQRRLVDWHFERAQTWEDLLAAHEKWLLDFNYQHHFAHKQREDGCHSPAAVHGWVKGMQPEPEGIYRAFSAVGEMRTISKAEYVRFRDYLLYGEQNLARERALVNLFQDVLTPEYQEQPLSRYSVEWQPDEKHLRRVGNPRLYHHPYQSAQLELWPLSGKCLGSFSFRETLAGKTVRKNVMTPYTLFPVTYDERANSMFM